MRFINSHKRIFLIALMVLTALTVVILLHVFRKTPENIIYKKIGLNLPYESEVIYFDHSFMDEDSVQAKIHLDEENIDDLLCQFYDESLFPQNHNYKKGTVMPNFSNLNDWFNVSDENIVHIFRTLRTDQNFKDKHLHEIWAFICIEDDNYYLYLSF